MSGNTAQEGGSIRYIAVGERRYSPELGAYRTYGILAVRAGRKRRAAYIPDVSADRAFVSGLAERYTAGKLSPIHLRDAVADALGI